tara:strand:- start:7905 stop:8390 length:486 start_codon:yes stop_codon:yes gene_type:complete
MFVKELEYTMRLLSLLFLLIAFNSFAVIDKAKYFTIFKVNSLPDIEAEINFLKKEKQSQAKDAFLGAMIMKKAQFMKTPKDKLSLFKEGKILLENAIAKEPKNIIYRFLRFVIQENCPKILKYNTQIRTDSNIIRQNYKSLDKITKEFVRDYAKKSEVLNL